MTERLCPSPSGGCEEPVQRAEQPHGLVDAWLKVAGSGGRVVMLAGQGLADPKGPSQWLSGPPRGGEEAWSLLEPLQRRALRLVEKPPPLLAAAVELLRRGLLSRLIYFGVDGAAARLAPRGSVLEVYGSVLRARCPRCGTRLEIAEPTAPAPRCPRCGAAMEPELVWPHGRPRLRVLGEAVYEATTADLVVACCLGGETLPTVLALSARRFTRLALLGSDPVLGEAAHLAAGPGALQVLLEATRRGYMSGQRS